MDTLIDYYLANKPSVYNPGVFAGDVEPTSFEADKFNLGLEPILVKPAEFESPGEYECEIRKRISFNGNLDYRKINGNIVLARGLDTFYHQFKKVAENSEGLHGFDILHEASEAFYLAELMWIVVNQKGGFHLSTDYYDIGLAYLHGLCLYAEYVPDLYSKVLADHAQFLGDFLIQNATQLQYYSHAQDLSTIVADAVYDVHDTSRSIHYLNQALSLSYEPQVPWERNLASAIIGLKSYMGDRIHILQDRLKSKWLFEGQKSGVNHVQVIDLANFAKHTKDEILMALLDADPNLLSFAQMEAILLGTAKPEDFVNEQTEI